MNAAAAPNHPFQPTDAPALILASASATRRKLLADCGLLFESRAAAVDEESIKRACQAEGTAPGETALILAEMKAERIRIPGVLVIGCDQLLTCDGTWFDKPRDRAEATSHLRFLRGRTHQLHTTVTVMKNGQVLWHHTETPRLTMRGFSDEFLETYLDSDMPDLLSSVGAYRLEGPGAQLFDRIEGNHATILGLPLLPLLGFLRQHRAVKS